MTDLLIVGAGPAGRALAHRAARHGVQVTLVDPAPEARWAMTIGAFVDDLPDWLDPTVVAAAADETVVYTPRRRSLPRAYAVLDAAALQDALTLDAVHVVPAAAARVTADRVHTVDGRQFTARVVVDARGAAEVSTTIPRQRAVGTFVAAADTAPEMVLMDWRATPVHRPSFSYRVRVDAHRDLVEETSLAADPTEIGRAELAQRNAARLPGARVGPAEWGGDEWVDFPMYATAAPWRQTPVRFGAAGGLMHPATGYSVAESLRWADVLAADLAAGGVGAALWPRSARWVYRLRLRGLAVLLGFDGPQITAFFDAFFALPIRTQRAYLSGRTDLTGVLAAMLAVFVRVPWRLRVAVALGFLRPGFLRPGRRVPAPGPRRSPCPRRGP